MKKMILLLIYSTNSKGHLAAVGRGNEINEYFTERLLLYSFCLLLM